GRRATTQKHPGHRPASPQPSSADSAPNPYPTPYHDRNDLATELTLTFHDASSTIPVRSVGWTTARNGGRRSESSRDGSDATGPADGATLSRSETSLLLTNDDGWDAPRLAALWQAAEDLGRCRLVAPIGPLSGCGHRVTTHGPIAITRLGEDRVAVAGTPADCVRLALDHLAPGVAWILSGINAGGNLGADVYHSGTVAAVREGVLHGVPGIALSHYMARGRVIDWPRAARWAAAVLARLLALPWEAGTFWNVNLPHLG